MHKLDNTFQKVLLDIVQHLYLLVTRCLYCPTGYHVDTITTYQSWNGSGVTEKAFLMKLFCHQHFYVVKFPMKNLPDELLADLTSWKASGEESAQQRCK